MICPGVDFIGTAIEIRSSREPKIYFFFKDELKLLFDTFAFPRGTRFTNHYSEHSNNVNIS